MFRPIINVFLSKNWAAENIDVDDFNIIDDFLYYLRNCESIFLSIFLQLLLVNRQLHRITEIEFHVQQFLLNFR